LNTLPRTPFGNAGPYYPVADAPGTRHFALPRVLSGDLLRRSGDGRPEDARRACPSLCPSLFSNLFRGRSFAPSPGRDRPSSAAFADSRGHTRRGPAPGTARPPRGELLRAGSRDLPGPPAPGLQRQAGLPSGLPALARGLGRRERRDLRTGGRLRAGLVPGRIRERGADAGRGLPTDLAGLAAAMGGTARGFAGESACTTPEAHRSAGESAPKRRDPSNSKAGRAVRGTGGAAHAKSVG